MDWLRQGAAALISDIGGSLKLDSASKIISDSSAQAALEALLADAAFEEAAGLGRVLDAFSLLMALDGVADHVAARLRPIALELLSRSMQSSNIHTWGVEQWEEQLSILAGLAGWMPELWGFIYAQLLASPLRLSPLSVIPDNQLIHAAPERLHRLLILYLRLILCDPQIARRLSWPSAPLHTLRTQHPDMGVRLLAIKVLDVQLGWSEAKRKEMEKAWVGDVDGTEAKICYGRERIVSHGTSNMQDRVIDGWLLPVLEAQRTHRLRGLASQVDLPQELLELVDGHLRDNIFVVGHTLVFRNLTGPASGHPFVHHVTTPAGSSALQAIASPLRLERPVLISAPASSGKTHILQYLSSLLYPSTAPTNRILTIPLADTTIDVKSLIGSYVSSPTQPGAFEWMEGALAKAIRIGRWVVFDDIDRASLEMLVLINGLARTLRLGRPGRRARLAIPGRPDVEAGEGFAMFATRSVNPQAYTPPTFFGALELVEVQMAAPTDDDVLAILTSKFAELPPSVVTPMVQIWHKLREATKAMGRGKAREIGLRDLEKWCARVEKHLPPAGARAALEQTGLGPHTNPSFQGEVLLEAADILFASFDNKRATVEKRAALIDTVAMGIGMDLDRATSLLLTRAPTLEVSAESRQLFIGRTTSTIAGVKSRRAETAPSRSYALTKPSRVLLERIAAAANMGEPTLLVGETGTGKTTAVQYIADLCHRKLTALNLSMQTETSDLLGGFKPLDASVTAQSIYARWQKLVRDTFGSDRNGELIQRAFKFLFARKWAKLSEAWMQTSYRAIAKLEKLNTVTPQNGADESESRRKRRRVVETEMKERAVQWQALLVEIVDFDLHHVKMGSKPVFSFIEGPLVKAMRSGEWLLLDEINLASQETLEAIATILEGPEASLVLTERGDVEPVQRHADFRLYACMNPATDVGKKDLPPSLRNRFTEIYVPPPDDDREALHSIVKQYLVDASAGDQAVIPDVADMYLTLKRLSAAKEIVDGSNHAPHYSMRTLARALTFGVQTAGQFGLRRGLWEGCLMAFTMSLDSGSAVIARQVCKKHLLDPLKNAAAVLAQVPNRPVTRAPPSANGGHSRDVEDQYVLYHPHYWLRQGPEPPVLDSRYIITPSVRTKLADLARVIMTGKYPVLIQGPTSAGKTSAVEYLANMLGHRFVRINNHEQTDIQEYLGTYVTDPQTGNLVFQEGLLVTAVRKGHWIVLDELNLAPTDVLEALNRLLDDNRELVIPETQEVIKPHRNFILFATQNPPGLYAGRKVLSRAFRNRFLEVHFDDVPKTELQTILCQRCQIAPSYAERIVQVFEALRHRRQASRVFESRQSFATLRDLFRWAERKAIGYEQLAQDGYMLLAERGRQDEDKAVIKQVIENIMKVKVDDSQMYRLFEPSTTSVLTRLPSQVVPKSTMVWTKAMQRLFALIAAALAHKEPVLLVGETGCGKTSVCEVIAHYFNQALVGVNCHQNMETADLLGSQRPVRNRHERRAKIVAFLQAFVPAEQLTTDEELTRACDVASADPAADQALVSACRQEIKQLSALFEWADGPLVKAMQAGDLLLLDEVSLADDSVLERLNSVLEPGRTLVLAEKGGTDIDAATLVADHGFHVVATMNPGGDFGKKELSPALRNRFTEIWVPALNDREDLLQIIGLSIKHEPLSGCAPLMLDFFGWFGDQIGDNQGLGLRDILAWVDFANQMFGTGVLDPARAFHEGGQLVIIDGLESLPPVAGMSVESIAALRAACLDQLSLLAASLQSEIKPPTDSTGPAVKFAPDQLQIGPYSIHRKSDLSNAGAFRFEAPTTALNAMRVLRGCQLPKAILLEGSPGVGKTSLVSALASVTGHTLQRMNLSDQTDLIDLFGSDLPVEGGKAGEFQWRDAAFLDAMQKGDWVLLDEMNLASQTILEGLNAVLDHRGTVYLPELGRSFVRHPDFRVFAAQNPLQQGGGRKGLPKSFLNRFTKVYLQEHTPEDLSIICRQLTPLAEVTVSQMILFNERIRHETMISRSIGRDGSPWEFNLRDLSRWFLLLAKRNGLELSDHPLEFLKMVYLHRFRNQRDRDAIERISAEVFGRGIEHIRPAPFVSTSVLQIGHSAIRRDRHTVDDVPLRHHLLDVAESVLKGVEMGWLVILAGEQYTGRGGLVRTIAQAAGRRLDEFAMNPAVDTSEILGSFEQQDFKRLLDVAADGLWSILEAEEEAGRATVQHSRDFKQALLALEQDKEGSLEPFLRMAEQLLSTVPEGPVRTTLEVHVRKVATADRHQVGFAWVDGQLVDAVRNGGWFLISDANLCNGSVLDRLNSLCEADGVLVLSEKGSSTGTPEVIRPHPDFRLFMTYVPRHGELSRAMRNRGVELYVDRPPVAVDRGVSSVEPILANDATARSLEASLALKEQSSAPASADAECVASALPESLPLMQRLNAQHGDGLLALARDMASMPEVGTEQVWMEVTPVDPSLNPHVPAEVQFGVYRALQLLARNYQHARDVQSFVADPANARTMLALSSAIASGRASRAKSKEGMEVYPVIAQLRDQLVAVANSACKGSSATSLQNIIGSIEDIHVLLSLLEKHNSSLAFDHSSTQLLAKGLEELAASSGISAGPLASLAKSTALAKGFGQTQIWQLFRSAALERLGDSEAACALLEASGQTADQGLRRDAIAAVAVYLSSATADDASLEAITTLVTMVPSTALLTGESRFTRLMQQSSLAVELRALLGLSSSQTPLFVSNADYKTYLPLALSKQTGLANDDLRAASVWLARLSQDPTADESEQNAQMAASILQPRGLAAALAFASESRIPLAEIDSVDEAFAYLANSTLFEAAQPVSRLQLAEILGCHIITSILSALDITVLGTARNARDLVSAIRQQAEALSAVMPWLASALSSRLDAIEAAVRGGARIQIVAAVWLAASSLLIEAFITNIPIDPAVRRVLDREVGELRLRLLQEEFQVVERSDVAQKGVSDSKRRQHVLDRLQAAQAYLDALGPAYPRQPDASRLSALFNEVSSFLDEAMSVASLSSLQDALRTGQHRSFQREEAFQLGAAAFLRRLQTIYSDMDDLIQPIVSAILFCRFGLACQARAAALHTFKPDPTLLGIIRFPPETIAGPTNVTETKDLRRMFIGTFDRALSMRTAVGGSTTELETVSTSLKSIYGAWNMIRTREMQDEQAAESLYRVKKTDVEVLPDDEQEAKEFAELFPQYDDIDEEQSAASGAASAERDISEGSFDLQAASDFQLVVKHCFFSRDEALASRLVAASRSLLDKAFDPEKYAEDLDQSSLAYRVDLLHYRSVSSQTSSEQPNFYLSPNEPEVRKAQAILARLRARLDVLVEEWPEQMILQHLRDRVDRYLALDIRSPVALILSALEQLMLHIQDWESYASRDNTLGAYQTNISDLIITWRRLELASWTRLLDDQHKQFITSDSEWSLRLFGVLIADASATQDIEAHIKTTLENVGTYLQTSNLGLYRSRLDLLTAFQSMASKLSLASTSASRNLDQIANLLANILANARLFLPKIESSLQTQRATLDKAIRDFVKLASWKDVNVFALKASAQKSHKHLHRSIRKFRDVLRQPVSPLLSDITAIVQQDEPQTGALASVPAAEPRQIPAGALDRREAVALPLPEPLKNAESTLSRYTAVHQRWNAGLSVAGGDSLDGMAVDVIERAAELAKATPSTLTKENTKIVNNLASRKRRAFADLLKALRASGFSANVKADQLARQQSATWLALRDPLLLENANLPTGIESDAARISLYHDRMGVLMPAVRAAFNGHNPDIASQDLQRGIGFAESIYAQALVERERLVGAVSQYATLARLVARLHTVTASASIAGGQSVVAELETSRTGCQRALKACQAIEVAIRKHVELEGRQATIAELGVVSDLQNELLSLLEKLEQVLGQVSASGCQLVTSDELALVRNWSDLRDKVIAGLGKAESTSPHFAYLYRPVITMASSLQTPATRSESIALSSNAWQQSDELIQGLLVVAQTLKSDSKGTEDEEERPNIPLWFSELQAKAASLRATEIAQRVVGLASLMAAESDASGPLEGSAACWTRILPFLEVFLDSQSHGLANAIFTVKSCFKLGYVTARVMLDLAQKGFCKPSEESESSKDGDEGNSVEGTGMGAGTGDKNVSSEIEDESQVEGLQGEEEEQEQDKPDREDGADAVEMEEDFEGDMGEGKEKEENADESGDEEEEDHDEHVGDVDPLDPGAVDEKFWGDEKEEEKEEQGGQELMDQKTQQEAGESEMAAKESEGKDPKKDKKEEEQQPEGGDNTAPEEVPTQEETADQQDEREVEGEDATMDDPDAQEEKDEQGVGKDEEVNVPEGDRLDIPDDINLDGDGKEGSDLDPEDDLSLPDDNDDDGDVVDDGTADDASMASQDDGAEDDNAPAPTGVGEEETMDQEEAPNQNLDLSASNEAPAQDASQTGKGLNAEASANADQPKPEEGQVPLEEAEGEAAKQQEESSGADSKADQPQSSSAADQPPSDEGPVDSTGAPMPAPQPSAQQNRSLGDILKDIQRRRDEILAQQERPEPTQDSSKAEAETSGQVEYLQKDDEDENMQALGPAGEEERQKLQDLNILDEQEEAIDDATHPGLDDSDQMDDDVEPQQEGQQHRGEASKPKNEEQAEGSHQEKGLTRDDVLAAKATAADGAADDMAVDGVDDGVEAVDVKTEDMDDEDFEEAELVQTDGQADASAEDAWRHYASLTSDLSYALCEQLRLILEPTLATRLQGDFRTGKRLNMRKIIPYIASEYTKDKIWLRRTKPSRREYQVLLCLDVSRSMAESHSVDLSFQTLALVAQALNKLEVGQVSMAKFGKNVEILHPFGDAGFTDADGAKVMRSFVFDQTKTDVVALMERTLTYLAESRQQQTASTTAPDLWQLQIIISDGVCEDHARLRTLLRRALEERVMVVFIIVDSLRSDHVAAPTADGAARPEPSILSTTTVEMTSVNGSEKINIRPYLDTFPFEFYVILRDVEALPGVLSDTLRQWMARVSQSQE